MSSASLEIIVNRFRILLFLLPFNAAIAACPTNIHGSSKKFNVTVLQDCGAESEIVITQTQRSKNNKEAPKEYQRAFLKSECGFVANTLSCHKNGKTILSGSTYLANDGPPVCPGDKTNLRYSCIRGCKESLPKHLIVDPYAC
jgi:hypothetical protein